MSLWRGMVLSVYVVALLLDICSSAPFTQIVSNPYESNVYPTEIKPEDRVRPPAPDLAQFEKASVECSNEPTVPSDEDVQDFLDLKPPVANPKAYEAKGLFEGDMTGMKLLVDPAKREILTPSDVTSESLRWPNKIIPYGFYEKIDRKSMEVTLDAMKDLEAKTCIRFVPLTYQEDYLKISPGQSCASDVGYSKGEHVLSVNPGCMDDLGALQHEIMHALGIIHEQARPDRDPFVYVNYTNIKPDIGSQAQFYIFKNAEVMDTGIPYDYDSVMHYPMDAFALDRKNPSIMPLQKGKMIGNRVELSALDIRRLNRLYRCDDNPLDETKNPIPQEARDQYARTWKEWAKLCDMSKDTPEGWDQDPDVCLDMCRKLDSKKLGPDLNNLFNRPSTKQCMHKRMLCDGTGNASYDKAQQPETCRKFCRLGGYVNMPVSAQCVHYSKLCNGKIDTQNGEDEDKQVCQDLCQSPATGFPGQLFNSEEAGMRCIKKVTLCDGRSRGALADPPYCQKYCKGGGFLPLGNSAQCVHWKKLCDGHVDTVSGLDEDPETCRSSCALISKENGGELFGLPSTRQCVSKRWLCDGTQHDKEDLMENPAFCQQKCRGSGFTFTKDNQQCFHLTNLCDGKQDVRNGWDENPRNCDKYCRGTSKWPPEGMALQQNQTTRQCQLVSTSSAVQATDTDTDEGDDAASAKIVVPDPVNSGSSSDVSAGTDRTPANQTADFGPVLIEPLSFTFGSEQPHKVGGSDDAWELIFPNNTHLLLNCPSGQVISVTSADYFGGSCGDLSAMDLVVHKCNDLPACGYIARDPSEVAGCSGRQLRVRYSCRAPVSVFRTDPSTDDLCAGPSSRKNVSLTVQCNLSVEALMP